MSKGCIMQEIARVICFSLDIGKCYDALGGGVPRSGQVYYEFDKTK